MDLAPLPRPANALVAELELLDPHWARHAANVALLAGELARALELPAGRVLLTERAAHLHDIGKRFVPTRILAKAGPLEGWERALLEEHAASGARLLAAIGLPDEALIVRHHHERYDGLGYPGRLEGREIPLEARIVAVADAYDAMTSARPFRVAMSQFEALEELFRVAGAQHDERITRHVPSALDRLARR
jgi:putative nucleotidyltransferase with HDIG domain